MADDIPIAIEHAFYPPDIGLELEKRDLTTIIMYSVFENELGLVIEEATQTIGAALADAPTAKLLGVKAGSPLLSMERLRRARTPGRWSCCVGRRPIFSPQYQPDAAQPIILRTKEEKNNAQRR